MNQKKKNTIDFFLKLFLILKNCNKLITTELPAGFLKELGNDKKVYYVNYNDLQISRKHPSLG